MTEISIENKAFVFCCNGDPSAVIWNPYNQVVQCGRCGHIYWPEPYDRSKRTNPQKEYIGICIGASVSKGECSE